MQRVKVFSLNGEAPLTVVYAGQERFALPCVLDADLEQLFLPRSFLDELGLEDGQEIHVLAHEGGGQVHIGPLVGFLVGRGAREKVWRRPARYRRVVARAQAAGAHVFFFDAAGVDFPSRRIWGWVQRGNRWEQVEMPFPDVIYNRDTYPNRRRRAAAARMRRDLAEFHKIAFINSVQSFPKWSTHHALRFFKDTAKMVPDTVAYQSHDDLRSMLDRYSHVFVKRNHSSHGSSVMRVSTEDGGWHVSGRRRRRRTDRRFTDWNRLCRFLDRLRKDNWVIQQGIDLAQVQGRVFDVRVIVQKDGHGEWRTVATLARWACRGQVVCNTSQGGQRFALSEFLQRFEPELGDILGSGIQGLEEEAGKVAELVAEVLETRFGQLGEIGVDIGVDRSGRLWVFEANTKPLHRRSTGIPLTKYIFQYAVYLARQQWSAHYTGLSWPLEV